MQSESFFLAAAVGWDHDGWQGRFYPDDLPPEWRLTYYANEFDAVLVPAERWSTVPEAELSRWVGDTRSAFRFFLGWDGSVAELAALSRATALLGGKFGGVLAQGTDAVERLPAGVLASCFSDELPLSSSLHALERRRFGACWRNGAAGYHCVATGLRSLWWREAAAARPLRDAVELLASGSQGAVLVIDGEPPALETLNAVRTIAALLGV